MSRFAVLANEFLQADYADHPVNATALGIDGHDEELDDLRREAFERRRHEDERWLAAFERLGERDIEPTERIDHRYLLSTLRGRVVLAGWEAWRRQPAVYLTPGLSGVHLLYLHRIRPPEELHRAAERRLRAIPWNLLEGQRNLDAALVSPVFIERAVGQARAGARYLRELLPREADGDWRARLAVAGRNAAASLDDFAAWLQGMRGSAAGDFAIGEERYTRILKEKELLPYSAAELRELGEHVYADLAAELSNSAREIDGSADWAALIERLRADAPRSPEELRGAYEHRTQEARTFLVEHGLVTMPLEEDCRVEPSPVFQRPILAVASYQGPPPFTRSRVGHFFVPYPPDGTPAAEVRLRLQGNSFHNIPTVTTHETYPGHHLQRVVRAGHRSAVRKSFPNAFFAEGWGLYAERVMREQGFFADPRAELFQLRDMLFRAARIVVDVGLHTALLSTEEAVRFLMGRAKLTEPNARAEVGRYCAAPVQASSYMTGQLEILQLRERYLRARRLSGVAGLRAFHDALLAGGDLPLPLAAEELLGA
jgi:uncharacterized protein (DUF885 family)